MNLELKQEKQLDTSRNASRERYEKTLQFKRRREALLEEELNEDRLRPLLTFISQLERTPLGMAELQHRAKHFGACHRIGGETSGQFYGRLRQWLDRDIPKAKLPRRASRQTDD